MGFWDKLNSSDRLDYLDEERKKIWQRLTELENDLKKRTSDDAKDAKQSSKMASEFRNRARETKEEIERLHSEIFDILNSIKMTHSSIQELKNESSQLNKESEEGNHKVLSIIESLEEKSEELDNKIIKIETVFQNHPNLEDELEQLDTFLDKAEENSNKTLASFKNILSRKKEIDNIYHEIVGYESKDEETGEVTLITGLKTQLENQYESLIDDVDELSKNIETIRSNSETNFSDYLKTSETENKQLRESWNTNYQELKLKIERLLPNALTTGLSYAFSDKKNDEVKSFEKLSKQFNIGIIGLILVSIIPFVLSVVFLIKGDGWDIVINRVPRIVLAILPLYLPVLWVAYSANKKINLSKRLIEEYAHKEVLSKTFEGLSSQIEILEDQNISKELRLKLLYNFLEVYSENPGKLISNYETSDHPVMDVLEKSYKLKGAVDKLQKIPGLEKVAQMIDSNTKRAIAIKDQQIKEALDLVEEEDEEEQKV